MAVVVDTYLGSTHVMVDDEFCVKTPEELEAVLQRAAEIYYRSRLAKALREQQAGNTSPEGETPC